MTLLLDIDGVTLTWWDRESTPYNGFDNYVHPGTRFFSRYSPEQLELIHNSFPNIIWHTTWSRHDNMANKHFCPTTGFCVRENLIDRYGGSVRGLPPEVVAACGRCNWWKLDAVALWLDAGFKDRFVWVDDDLSDTWHKGVEVVLDYYDALDRCLAIAPRDGWTRNAIEDAALWLPSSEPGRFLIDNAYRG
jgi:hypothetical protein